MNEGGIYYNVVKLGLIDMRGVKELDKVKYFFF